MKSDTVQNVSQKVYRRFPEFKGIKPKVRSQNTPNNGNTVFLLTYETRAKLADDRYIQRWVRVVADDSGKIIKISTSR